ncbi:hypothetical protein V8J36_04765 [Frigidibacter sp. MR17.14]|uniref:hypothetical protein n=1 Tax=Frigidibacter sp. MR17.14 TaxID=3126509 RepID=UPI003012BCF6
MVKIVTLFLIAMMVIGLFGAFRFRGQRCRRCGRPFVARHGEACRCKVRKT